MIEFSFEISNPWSNLYKVLKIFHGKITKNKYWELTITRSSHIISLGVSVTARRDHAGFRVHLALLSLAIELNIYDHRHWDLLTNNWSKHNDFY